jgi:hypothetical protein
MDFPHPHEGSTDVFSLSDQGIPAPPLPSLQTNAHLVLPQSCQTSSSSSRRSALATGAASGYVAQRRTPTPPTPTGSSSSRKPRSRSSSCTGPRPPRLLHASDRCASHHKPCLLLFLISCARSWNEMKIVRSFKSDPHPSIIPFHSFIITPSYALITM